MPKHAVLFSPNNIAIEERDSKELEAFEARVRVRFAGVCGTDIALFSGAYPVPLPLTLGHEFCGEVVEAGDKKNSSLVGQRCAVEINNDCIAREAEQRCEACRRGMPRHCQTRTVVGIIQSDGAFAEEIVVPARNAHPLPDSLSDRHAVFVEPVAAALQTFKMAPPGAAGEMGQPLDAPPWLAVLGVGRLGLLIAAVAKSMGVRVIGVGRSPEKLSRAEPYCDRIIRNNNDDALVAEIHGLTGGLGADYVVEATGAPTGLHLALNLTRPRGVLALKSTPGLPLDNIDLTKIAVDEIRIQGSRCGPFDEAIDLLASGRIDLDALIEAEYPLQEAAEALHAAARASKVLIRCAS